MQPLEIAEQEKFEIGDVMKRELWKELFLKEWWFLVLVIAGSLLVFHLLPTILPDVSFFTFFYRTGWDLGDFVFFALIISAYLVRAIGWAIKRAIH